MKSKIIDINKYALTLHNIHKLKVNRDLVNEEEKYYEMSGKYRY